MSAAADGGPWPRHIIDGCLFSRVSGGSSTCVACDGSLPVLSSLFATEEKALSRTDDGSSVERWQ